MTDSGPSRADLWLARDDSDADLVVVGVPSSRASGTRADLTPLALRDRLGGFSTFDSERGIGFGDVAVRDVGNWPVSQLEPAEMRRQIADRVGSLPDAGLTLYLGGDSAITRPLVTGLGNDPQTIGVISFSANHQAADPEAGHANRSVIRELIQFDGIPGANIVQIGINSFADGPDGHDFCALEGVSVYTVTGIEGSDVDDITDRALSSLDRCESILVQVDLGVLDQVYAPAALTARPGGLTVRQLAAGVRRCARNERASAFTFVEIDATADGGVTSLDAMAYLLLSAALGFTGR